jgi:SAM-dependent methyltransferase
MESELRYPPPLRLEFFQRQDESDDAGFYAEPRLVTHIDDDAIAALSQCYAGLIRPGSAVLDLMSSWISHLPAEFEFERLVGLGMNETELAQNPALTERVIQDLNRNPVLPFENESFAAAVVTVSVQYLVRPVEVFAEVGRTLKRGAPFAVAYSNRMFPTKAVAIWQSLSHRERADLIGLYFRLSGRFGPARAIDVSPGPGSDPMVVVVAETLLTRRAGR